MQAAKQLLEDKGYTNLNIPQARPLSAGETLGCTAPTLPPHVQTIVFVADGRFHLEALLIANPSLPAFRCCFTKLRCQLLQCFVIYTCGIMLHIDLTWGWILLVSTGACWPSLDHADHVDSTFVLQHV